EWRKGQFYPEGLKQKDELHWASRHVTAIEINATFYQNQKPASFEAWAAQTPDDFVFTVKGHQAVTHIKRLKDVEQPLELFFRSIEALGKRLGAVCWQLPGNLKFDPERLEGFLRQLPKGVRQAVEVRSPTFADPAAIELLRAHNVALVIADTADWPYLDQTADFAYARLQGAPGAERYEAADLDRWAAAFKALSEGRPLEGKTIVPPQAAQPERDVFAFFVSTDKPNAPVNALGIQQRLGITAATD
ncbi:MAG TPA: DUF72 domain-containing protein, partial [Devosia sp.]|nr:DUF72 domain-containing protein [Devosia sp.]